MGKKRRTLEHCFQIDADRLWLLALTESERAWPGCRYMPDVADAWMTVVAKLCGDDVELAIWDYADVLREEVKRKVGIEILRDVGPLLRERVETKATRTPLGGLRRWLVCPTCATRRKALYWDGNSPLRCRVCLGLQYASSQRNRRLAELVRSIPSLQGETTWRPGHDWQHNQERRNKYRRDKRKALREATMLRGRSA